MVTELTKGFRLPKPRFQHVGPPVFRTENITVTAFVAEISEVGNLVFLFQDQFSAFFNRPVAVLKVRVFTGTCSGGMESMKLASFGQTGMHLSQVRQSNNSSMEPTLVGGLLFLTKGMLVQGFQHKFGY